jgi:hypothetical protein
VIHPSVSVITTNTPIHPIRKNVKLVSTKHHHHNKDAETGTTSEESGESDDDDKEELEDDIETGDLDVEHDALEPVEEFMGESVGFIRIPYPGECRPDQLPEGVVPTLRDVRNGCAICLCTFEVEDRISWSGNVACTHVFHHKCIVDWLVSAGKKHLRRQQRDEERSGVVQNCTPIAKVTSSPMLCPCCRQEFIDRSADAVVEKEGDKEVACTDPPTRTNSEDSVPVHPVPATASEDNV